FRPSICVPHICAVRGARTGITQRPAHWEKGALVSSLVVGSVALDTVETPFGRVDEALGGTALYFSLAASLFTDVMLVGVIGDDFPDTAIAELERRNVDLQGLQRRPGETFRW